VIQTLARSFWVRLAFTGVILAYLVASIDLQAALQALLGVDLRYVALVASLVALDRVVMIWRWIVLLRATGTPVQGRTAARIFLESSFVGSFLPAGVGGDAARAWQLSRHTARSAAAVASVAVDRLLGVVAIVVLGAAGVFASARLFEPDQQRRLFLVAAALAAGAACLLWIDRLTLAIVPRRWRDTRWGRRLQAVTQAVAEYRSQPGALATVLALSFGVQWLRILQAWLLGRGLGIDVPFVYYLAFMPIALLLLLLPISVSGFGLPQGAIVWLLRPVGVPDEQSFALSTLILLSGLAGNLPGALLYLKRKGRRD
jgi:uncharacterized membrane protein YbhN (UPF0104 family)